jgi:two-component system, NarL family, response regulator DevR
MLTDNPRIILYAVFSYVPVKALISTRKISMEPSRKTEHSAEEHSDDMEAGENTQAANHDNKIIHPASTLNRSDGMKLKVFIADDSLELRKRLKEMLEENKSIHLVGEAEDAGQAITALDRLKPDVVILDVHMPGGGGMRVLRNIVLMGTDTVAIVFTAFANAQYRQAYLAAGADYFFDKTHDVQNMIDTLDELAGKRPGGGNHDEKPDGDR